MKKLVSFLLLAVVILSAGLTGCSTDKKDKEEKNSPEKSIEKAVSDLKFPQELRDGTKLTNLTYNDNTLTFYIEMEPSRMEKLDADSARIKTLENLRTGLYPKPLINTVIKANSQIRYIYKSGNDSIMFTFSADQLK